MATSAEIISEAIAKDLKVTEVPISTIYTKDDSVRHRSGVLNWIIVMISEKRPLLFFGLGGGIFILLGLGAGFSVIRTYYTSYVLAVGTALIVMLFVTLSILSISTGIILNVLVKRISSSL